MNTIKSKNTPHIIKGLIMSATQCLRDEHQVILRVLDCFEIALHQADDNKTVTVETFAPFVEFFKDFADKCHHCKEEDRLFPRLENAGIPREGGPIGVMLYEHEQGRSHIRAIAEHLDAANSGDAAAHTNVIEHGLDFVALLRSHINKENGVLFNMADQIIRDDNLAALNNDYEAEMNEPTYCTRFQHTRELADTLIAKYGVEPL